MAVAIHAEAEIGFVVSFVIGDAARDWMSSIGYVDFEVHVMFIGGSRVFDSFQHGFIEEVLAADNFGVLGPVLEGTERVMKDNEAFAVLETGEEILLCHFRDFL